MDKRKETPDILGDLLGGESSVPAVKPAEQQDSKPASQEPSKTAESQTGKPARRQASKPAKRQASKPAEEPEDTGKIKATYYLSLEAMNGLEAGWLALRKMADREQRTSISKSQILEQALLLALEELQEKGSQSKLAKKILKP